MRVQEVSPADIILKPTTNPDFFIDNLIYRQPLPKGYLFFDERIRYAS
jgi:hypothetical protein